MNIKEIEKVVGKIQSNLFRNSNSYSIGMLKSHFKGAGLQFKEHQVYEPGDDVRFIDWKLSAKTSTTYVKTFEEERNVELYAVIDFSETMHMGYKNISKLQAAVEITCLLYLLAQKTKDKVSAIIFTDEMKRLPLASGHEGIVLLVTQLQKMGILDEQGKFNFDFKVRNRLSEKKKISIIKSFVARGKQVIFLTDFDDIQDFETINKLIYRPNMHCFKLESPVDSTQTLPFSIFVKKNNKRQFVSINAKKNESVLKGRYKKLSVKDRYLEGFIREML